LLIVIVFVISRFLKLNPKAKESKDVLTRLINNVARLDNNNNNNNINNVMMGHGVNPPV